MSKQLLGLLDDEVLIQLAFGLNTSWKKKALLEKC